MICSNNKKNLHETELRYAKQQIASYIITYKNLNIEDLKISKPDPENLQEVLEYQQLFDLNIEIIVGKQITEIKKETDNYAKELMNINENKNINLQLINWPRKLSEIISMVRNDTPKKTNQQWTILEAIIEKTIWMLRNGELHDNLRNKPGRKKIIRTNNEVDPGSVNMMENFIKTSYINTSSTDVDA